MRNKRFVDFNKEIISGEIGAILGAALGGFVAVYIAHTRNTISFFVLLFSILSASTFFILTKIRNQKKEGIFSIKNIFKEIAYYSPVACLFGVFVGYPFLFLLTKHFLKVGFHPYSAGIISEFTVFLFFLFSINIYRFVLLRVFNREI